MILNSAGLVHLTCFSQNICLVGSLLELELHEMQTPLFRGKAFCQKVKGS